MDKECMKLCVVAGIYNTVMVEELLLVKIEHFHVAFHAGIESEMTICISWRGRFGPDVMKRRRALLLLQCCSCPPCILPLPFIRDHPPHQRRQMRYKTSFVSRIDAPVARFPGIKVFAKEPFPNIILQELLHRLE